MITIIPIMQYENCIIIIKIVFKEREKEGRTSKLTERIKHNEQELNQDSKNKNIRCKNK